MIKRLGISGVVVAILALAVGVVGPALGSGGQEDGEHQRWIQVTSINTEEDFVDVGAEGFSLGDEFIFTSKLMKNGKQVGHAGVVCTITSTKNRGESQCVGTTRFDGRGQITVQGLLAGEPKTFVIAITGGTGSYEGAEGTLRVRQFPNRETLTFHLSD